MLAIQIAVTGAKMCVRVCKLAPERDVYQIDGSRNSNKGDDR